MDLIFPAQSSGWRVNLIIIWFGAALTGLIFSILLFIYLSTPKTSEPASQNFSLFAAVPDSTGVVLEKIDKADARVKIVEDFFKDYNSLLSDYSHQFIDTADKYRIDWRLLPSIAMQESNGGKRVISSSYNPFGYGIYTNSAIKFSSWEEGIDRVGRALRQDYLDQGLKTPTQIMTKYTPPSLAKGGTWAIGVSSFMSELR